MPPIQGGEDVMNNVPFPRHDPGGERDEEAGVGGRSEDRLLLRGEMLCLSDEE
jgi:hypothetical protein